MVISILLIIFFIAVAAFWPSLWTWLKSSHRRDRKSS
jgi:hypothetical protein